MRPDFLSFMKKNSMNIFRKIGNHLKIALLDKLFSLKSEPEDSPLFQCVSFQCLSS